METEVPNEIFILTRPLAMLIAAAVGAIIAIITNWLSIRNTRKLMKKELSIPRLFDALERIELTIINIRKGHKLDENELDEFTIQCGWLPRELNNLGLSLVSNIQNNEDYSKIISSLHSKIRQYKQNLIS